MLAWTPYNIKPPSVHKNRCFYGFQSWKKKIKLSPVIRKNSTKTNWRWYEKRIHKKIVIKIYLLLNEIENGHKTTSKHTAKDFASSTFCTTIFIIFFYWHNNYRLQALQCVNLDPIFVYSKILYLPASKIQNYVICIDQNFTFV